MDDEKAASTTEENETPPVAEVPKKKTRAKKTQATSQEVSNNVSSSGNGAAEPAIKPAKPAKEGTKSIADLVEDYNEMVATAVDLGIKGVEVVKTFDSVKLGTQACERLHSQIETARDPERKAMRKSSKARFSGKKKADKPAKSTASARGPRVKWEDTDKIVWTGKEIPYREGSEAHARVKVVEDNDGKTYKTFKANAIDKKLVRGSTLGTCLKAGLIKKG